ncbi:hypothetical protein M9H77_22818 [Catharanthus roseus]|uniref:Uncharacterized protein n=1 Tax=Catharanthus roseus TaxID=4058 RepID=A0ACC0AT23_CATRO|nr:hypothetical protein M9H77_22818 [Catharanthus roseus]
MKIRFEDFFLDRYAKYKDGKVLEELGYEKVLMVYYYLEPGKDIREGLIVIAGNVEICKMCSYIPRVMVIEIFADIMPEEEIMEIWLKSPEFNSDEPKYSVVFEEIEGDAPSKLPTKKPARNNREFVSAARLLDFKEYLSVNEVGGPSSEPIGPSSKPATKTVEVQNPTPVSINITEVQIQSD